ncbi:hypothetical protein [Kocuria rhizophila]|uniref:hypothetical protein n=1 Tax=Kocuria rhizophila TaxID=72000 RepID=UPI00190B5A7D|nr:hypothetical protein [Kocuria rhizophila]MBK4120374.1 hypothetical protein [Kocuria rhizophila]
MTERPLASAVKMTRHPDGYSTFLLSDSTIYIDDFHRKLVGLDFVDTRCVIQSFQDNTKPDKNWTDLSLVETRPERIREFASDALAVGLSEKYRLRFIFPARCSYLVSWLLQLPEFQQSSIRNYTVTSHIMAIEFGPSEAGDIDAQIYFNGFDLGMQLSTHQLDTGTSDRREAESRSQLIELLQGLESFVTPHSDEAQTPAPGDKVTLEDQEIERVQLQLVKLTTQHDALTRKYDSLAKSTMGRLTLKLWDRKKIK